MGKNTIYIYIMHGYILDFLMKYIANVYILIIFAIVVPMVFPVIIKKFYILNALLFGENSGKK